MQEAKVQYTIEDIVNKMKKNNKKSDWKEILNDIIEMNQCKYEEFTKNAKKYLKEKFDNDEKVRKLEKII